ncbi:MAG: DUF1028 domain-containing protein [Acidobacteriota bacterium]
MTQVRRELPPTGAGIRSHAVVVAALAAMLVAGVGSAIAGSGPARTAGARGPEETATGSIAGTAEHADVRSRRPAGALAHTFSIVARDPKTGELGVAVQSHWFSVGSLVTWAQAGVGAVATQSFVEPAYGPDGLALMKKGATAPEALRQLIEKDPTPDVRQVAMVDARGNVAAHTGKLCIPAAGHHLGEGYSVQANLMLDAGVWPAMARAYETETGDLADRLLAALEAAQEAGGDIRGRQSAAILVVRGQPTGKPYLDRVLDLRIEDNPRPVQELRRLVSLSRAYGLMNDGDEHIAAKRYDEALQSYAAAERLFPDNDEFIFWHAAALATIDRVDDAMPVFRRSFLLNPSWQLLVPRLVSVGLLPDDPEVTRRILSMGPSTGASPAPEPTRSRRKATPDHR